MNITNTHYNGQAWSLTRPCPRCGSDGEGTIYTRNNQHVVYCPNDHYAYCAPREETGQAVRSVSRRATIKPTTSYRVFSRYGHTCAYCRRDDQPLEIGHLIALNAHHTHNVPQQLLDDELNLAPLCEEHNRGQSDTPITPGNLARLIDRLLANDPHLDVEVLSALLHHSLLIWRNTR